MPSNPPKPVASGVRTLQCAEGDPVQTSVRRFDYGTEPSLDRAEVYCSTARAESLPPILRFNTLSGAWWIHDEYRLAIRVRLVATIGCFRPLRVFIHEFMSLFSRGIGNCLSCISLSVIALNCS